MLPLGFLKLVLRTGFGTAQGHIPSAGRVDISNGNYAENLVLEGVAGIGESDKLKLVDVKDTSKYTTLCLAAAHVLVRLDDGTIVGEWYDVTYKWYTRCGSRVLALGTKESMSIDKINKLPREDVESCLVFAGFLVFY
ncbi:uncharacterized protein EDB91DRAFT_1352148 [Suillus paluster]|uniref:uncharacterized protein n=1 Tax=Suillus paluster TaxID=48578 RepID=UPI001B862F06|nr:uncharacterized protein EDB91DRAFT_1352148 [Suillus paluster]KAG1718916.1 hypothetical protein EDB91DRAFT_1352148 [Suillus paluster]